MLWKLLMKEADMWQDFFLIGILFVILFISNEVASFIRFFRLLIYSDLDWLDIEKAIETPGMLEDMVMQKFNEKTKLLHYKRLRIEKFLKESNNIQEMYKEFKKYEKERKEFLIFVRLILKYRKRI